MNKHTATTGAAANAAPATAVENVKHGILIDMHEPTTDSQLLKEDLINLRETIRDLASAAVDTTVSVSRYETNLIVLNWLIEEVDLIDIEGA